MRDRCTDSLQNRLHAAAKHKVHYCDNLSICHLCKILIFSACSHKKSGQTATDMNLFLHLGFTEFPSPSPSQSSSWIHNYQQMIIFFHRSIQLPAYFPVIHTLNPSCNFQRKNLMGKWKKLIRFSHDKEGNCKHENFFHQWKIWQWREKKTHFYSNYRNYLGEKEQ